MVVTKKGSRGSLKRWSVPIWGLYLLAASCSDNSDPFSIINGGNSGPGEAGDDAGTGSQSGWTIPASQVYDGGPGKDGIPSVDDPQFVTVGEINYLEDADLVVGVNYFGEIRAYPHKILDWHEIVNDHFQGHPVSVNYCPLTGSAMNWSGVLGATESSFGVSGLLYNTNLILYDRATDSNWSQMLMQSVNGELVGTKADLLPLIETTWGTWKKLYPNSQVMTTVTGYGRPYDRYPYGSYRENDALIFPVSTLDNRLAKKERVAGIVLHGSAKVYRFASFGDSVRVINDIFQLRQIVVVGSDRDQILNIFGRDLPDGTRLELTAVQDQLPAVMVDQEGNLWDIFGIAVAGRRVGEQLPLTQSFIAYWFAFGTFYPEPEIYTD